MGIQPGKLLFLAALLITLLVPASVARAFSFCFTSEGGSRNKARHYSSVRPSDIPYPRGFQYYPYSPVTDSSWHQPYFPPPAADITGDSGVPVNPWEVRMQPDTELY